jgi:Clostridial hydrophobic W
MPQMGILDAIGLRHGTDKASQVHNYLSFYELFFADLKDKNISLLEVGVLYGASLNTWKEYFPNAKIVGVDISPSTKIYEGDRIFIELLDQSNIEELTRVAIKHGPFDIIIEDGSHLWEHQITSLRTLFPFVKDGGIYIVEDLQTNYGPMRNQFKGISNLSCAEYLKSLVDLHVGGNQISMDKVEDAFLRTYGQNLHFITFYRHMCLIRKRFPIINRELVAGSPLVADLASDRSVRVRVNAHVSFKGDIVGGSGFVNIGPDTFSIQGFFIVTDEKILEYRVRQEGDSTWGDWHESGNFAGTRGQSKSLVGFTVRLKKEITDRYVLRAFGRFAGAVEPVQVGDGQDCVSAREAPLCGIQIEITEHMQNSS